MSKTPVKLNIPKDQIVPDILPKCKKPLFAQRLLAKKSALSLTNFAISIMAMPDQLLLAKPNCGSRLVNADANESDLLLNLRMGYVAVSRAREDAVIFTNSIGQLRAALDRRVDKEMALEALKPTQSQTQLSRNDLTQGGPSGYEQEPGEELHSIERGGEGTSNDQSGKRRRIRN